MKLTLQWVCQQIFVEHSALLQGLWQVLEMVWRQMWQNLQEAYNIDSKKYIHNYVTVQNVRKKHGHCRSLFCSHQCECGLLIPALWPSVSSSRGKGPACIRGPWWWHCSLVAMMIIAHSDPPGDSEGLSKGESTDLGIFYTLFLSPLYMYQHSCVSLRCLLGYLCLSTHKQGTFGQVGKLVSKNPSSITIWIPWKLLPFGPASRPGIPLRLLCQNAIATAQDVIFYGHISWLDC